MAKFLISYVADEVRPIRGVHPARGVHQSMEIDIDGLTLSKATARLLVMRELRLDGGSRLDYIEKVIKMRGGE